MHKSVLIPNWTSVTANVAALVLASAFSPTYSRHIFTPLFIPQLFKPAPQEGDKYLLLEWIEHLIPAVMETHWPKRGPPEPMWKKIPSIGHPWSFDLTSTSCDCRYPSWRGWMRAAGVTCAVTRRQIENFWWDFPLRAALFAQHWQSAAAEVRWRTPQRGHPAGMSCSSQREERERLGLSGRSYSAWYL